jgi:hypothetical protein
MPIPATFGHEMADLVAQVVELAHAVNAPRKWMLVVSQLYAALPPFAKSAG